jgi:galactokinase
MGIMSPPLELFVPGRVCLFGEHSDWAAGHRRDNPAIAPGRALVVGANQGLHARVSPLPDTLRLEAHDERGRSHGPFSIPMTAEALLASARAGGFASYVAGAAYRVLQRHPDIGGLHIDNHHTTLPVKKGLSSSAAACVLTARAFGRLYGLGLSILDEMELAYQGETTTPSQCGRLDQACAWGSVPVSLGFDGDTLTAVESLWVGADLHLVVVDLRAEKDTRRILADLNACYPRADSDIARDVQRALGPENLRLTGLAEQAIRAGDAAGLGSLMVEAQRIFDRWVAPACPEELTAPALHRLLEHPGLQPLIHGGKGVGSQGDGAAQLLCRGSEAQRAVMAMVEDELAMAALPLTIPRNTPPSTRGAGLCSRR